MVEASTTVGTPTAIVGMPRVCRLIAMRLLPTPEPGLIPESATWIVVCSRSRRRAARASITITRAGLIRWTRAEIISPVSIPVVPRTPGERAQTARNPSPNMFWPVATA